MLAGETFVPGINENPERLLLEPKWCGICYVVIMLLMLSLFGGAMPNITAAQLLPTNPLHWTSILHYLVLALAIFSLVTSGDKASILHILILAMLALLTGADLYVDRISIPRLFVFIIRVLIMAIPLIMAGMAPTEQTRNISILTAVFAIPILFITFFSCVIQWLGDPRILSWC